jgi:RNA polymerase-binding transcription factor DksA
MLSDKDSEVDDMVQEIEDRAKKLLVILDSYPIADDDFESITSHVTDIIQMSMEYGVESITKAEEKKKNRSMRSKLYDAVGFQNICSKCGCVINTHQAIFCDAYCIDCQVENIKYRGIRKQDGIRQE